MKNRTSINSTNSKSMASSSDMSRRRFMGGTAAFSTVLGSEIVFQQFMPKGLIPVALAETAAIDGKHPGLVVLNDRPVNAETPPHLLDDEVTPASNLFIRNNGIPPINPESENWTLEIAGESIKQSKTWSLANLKKSFKHYTYQLTIECGGNGRAEFSPPAKGNQWTTGAVACPKWTGVRLKDVLQDSGIKDDAVYIGYYGADTHLSGNPDLHPISRGVPMTKALEAEALIAWAINDEPLPIMNGYPLRLVFGGWPASTSGKWLKKIVVRNQVHDGAKMTGSAYRVPCDPVAPGSEVNNNDMCIIEQMPVKSLITFPKSGVTHRLVDKMIVRGHAWAGDKSVKDMEVSIDFGQTWSKVSLTQPVNKNAWQHWEAELTFPKAGYYEIWAKATDEDDIAQPMVLPGWNPKGYLNNAAHRIAVKVV